jgi:hypothetical protein
MSQRTVYALGRELAANEHLCVAAGVIGGTL